MGIEFNAPMSLFVSLARNDAELARAAIDGGADALKVHMNVGHRASGNVFGPLEDERPAFERILALGVPVGLVVGGEGQVDRTQVEQAKDLGFSFFDVYLHHAPAWYVEVAPAGGAMVAIAHDHPLDRAAELERMGIAALEASVAAPAAYGTPLHLGALADVARLRRFTGLPLVVPTQHAIEPGDVPTLRAAGADAVLIGAVVTGTDPDGVGRATTSFRAAIDGVS